MTISNPPALTANQRNAFLSGFLGWTFDAFDFFILTFVLAPVAKEFDVTVPDIALTLGISLAFRPVGALIFGLAADRFGRRRPLMACIAYYSLMEVLSGLAPNFLTFFILRMLFGIGMGGVWGVGASLAMESAPMRLRGVLSGLLQEGYALGNLLASGAYAVVFPHWGWRAMFWLGTVPALLILPLLSRVKESEAWHRSRTDMKSYGRAISAHVGLFLYMVLLMTMVNFIAHGTQDIYPTFLQRQLHYSPSVVAAAAATSMLGAICGGLVFGLLSDRLGRRRAMVTAVLLALVVIPVWLFAPNFPLVLLGAFLMQFMVQGAWGVVPAHINELSPDILRGFFPGFAYQVGVLIASVSPYVETRLGEHFGYGRAMGVFAAVVLFLGAFVIGFGPEAKGIEFGRGPAAAASPEANRT
jgi:SHS family lactate transporter-like MFS transporter